jgi:hypothetical protein
MAKRRLPKPSVADSAEAGLRPATTKNRSATTPMMMSGPKTGMAISEPMPANDEVERRADAPTAIEAALCQSSIPSLAHRINLGPSLSHTANGRLLADYCPTPTPWQHRLVSTPFAIGLDRLLSVTALRFSRRKIHSEFDSLEQRLITNWV